MNRIAQIQNDIAEVINIGERACRRRPEVCADPFAEFAQASKALEAMIDRMTQALDALAQLRAQRQESWKNRPASD